MTESLSKKYRLLHGLWVIAIAICLVWFGYEVTSASSSDDSGAGILIAGFLYATLLTGRWYRNTRLESTAWSNLDSSSAPGSAIEAGPVVASDALSVSIIRHANLQGDVPASLTKIKVRRQLSQYLSSEQSKYSLDYVVLSVKLDVVTPHIFIDGRLQNRYGTTSRDLWSLTKRVSKKDELQDLEGDFPRYFTVYTADKQYLSALTILTPDVMIKLRDDGYVFDYEIYDGHLFVITDSRLTSEAQMNSMLLAARACLDELIPQITKHSYHDGASRLRLSNGKLHFWALVYSARTLGVYMLKIILAVLLGVIAGGMLRGILAH